MMILLVFLVILFGLIGVVSTQYITQYRNAYYIWVKEKIFKGETANPVEKLDLCSKIEAYSRELCEINDMLFVLLYMLYFTLIVILISGALTLDSMNYNIHSNFADFTKEDQINIIQIVASLTLTLLIFIAIPILFSFLKVSIINPKESSSIDKMLFDLWWKHKCHRCKDEEDKKNMQPIRLYELLDENIKNGKITDYTEDEKELVKNLTKTNGTHFNP